ncbi:nitroreductase family protein [Massilia sp. ST3]|uniref:nitroreductase family protein n=1 Tax=Massilia sp. ST3 TaxID=2824903 RepID=UPI001B83B329|nr:nitroreductase family protein [Massilia sp. ST3]MBQ5947418.1 nitroreductase family protein [Massilia sp. ST3]
MQDPRTSHALLAHLAARRNTLPRRLAAPGPDQDDLHRILEAAACAPDHGRLLPWRFILIPDHKRAELGAVFAAALAERDPDCGDEALAAARQRAFHAPCLIAAVLVDDPAAGAPPRAEKLVSLGCAIQNMLLAAQCLDFASGLASGGAMHHAAMRALLGLACHEEAVCFIAFGTPATAKAAPARAQPGQFYSVL